MKYLFFIFLFLKVLLLQAQYECDVVADEAYIKSFINNIVSSEATMSSRNIDLRSGNEQIRVQFHHFVRDDGSGQLVTQGDVDNALQALNDALSAPLGATFVHHSPLILIPNTTYYDFDKDDRDDLINYEIPHAFNIFITATLTSDGSSIAGTALFPGNGNNFIIKANRLNTSTNEHEAGHVFSILHTHSTSNGEELVARTNCDTAGDTFCDTEADPNLSGQVNTSCTYTGNDTDADGSFYNPPISNYMSYSRRSCRDQFSGQQENAMLISFLHQRYYFASEDPNITINTYPYTIGFENGLIETFQTDDYTSNWITNSGPTPSNSTGPSNATEGNFYAYFEASFRNNPTQMASITTPYFDLSTISNPYIEFSYHMYGSSMGTLELQMSTDNGNTWSQLFQRTGDQGNQWNTEMIDLNTSENTALFKFVGTTGSGFRSDLAIDNIIVNGNLSLPIELNYFSAQSNGLDAVINWNTASETNNDYFLVERSIDGSNFEVVALVESLAEGGNSQTELIYEFTDKGVGEWLPTQTTSDRVYYRLKQVDYDGSHSYSQIKAVNFSDLSLPVILYPNPIMAGQSVILKMEGIKKIEIFTINGRLVNVIEEPTVVESSSIPTSNLGKGIYLIVVNGTKSMKLVVP